MSNKKVIDISEHNGTIDFAKVREAGIKDVIIRVGWIGNKENHTIDIKFEEYYKLARYYGFNIGIYVYSYCKSKEAILNGCRWIEKKLYNKRIDLPVFLDLEDKTIEHLSKSELTNHAIEFCKYFKSLGYKVGVYANLYWFNNKLNINDLLDYKIWLAQYTTAKTHSFRYKVDLWQYTSTGKINGIKGNCDISYCMCNCDNNKTNKKETKKEDFEVAKTYKNGSTKEPVYSDSLLKNQIGSLDKYETCECLGIVQGHYIVKYKINGTNNYKVGFVKYSGGVK